MMELGDKNGAALRSEVAAAMGERALRAALASGVLTQIWRGVVVHSADVLDLRTRAAAAVLVAGENAVLSGPTAVALHGCTAAECDDVHLTVPYSRCVRSRPGLVVHQNWYIPDDVVERDGLPVFTLDLALADFLCDGDKRTAFASLDQALAGQPEPRRDELRAGIRRHLADRDDRRGVTKALMLTDLATGMADSPPESWFRLIVVEAGFPIPEPQYKIFSVDGRVLYILDMAWPERRIALEYDGYAAHEERAAHDAERDERMARRGWIVLRARAEDARDPSRLIADLRAAFEKRSR